MVPSENEAASLQWRQYAAQVAQKLTLKGLRETQLPDVPTYMVIVRYGVDEGRRVVSSIPVLGTTGGGTSTTTGTIGSRPFTATTTTESTLAIVGYRPVESTLYGRVLKITIVDTGLTLLTGKPATIYEATATSSGGSNNIAIVMPAMIEAVFKDWPGLSGSTRRVELPIAE